MVNGSTAQQRTGKTLNIKIPQIARWRIAGISDVKIQQLLGMSPGGLARILATQEYQEYEAALMNGHLSAMDQALAGKVEAIHQEFKTCVPAALRCLVDTVTQRRDLKAALEAAKTIFKLDPERTFAEAGAEAVAPGVPAEILDAAAEDGNKVAASLDSEAKKAVN